MKEKSLLVNNGINIDDSLELLGDMDTYNETLEEFLNTINDKMSKIKQFKESADMTNYAILVHSLKSDAKYLGFTTLARLAYQHEMASKVNNIGYVENNYNELITETQRIINLIKKYLGTEEITLDKKQNSTPSTNEKTILVVDDSTIIGNLIQKICADRFNIVQASDGEEALNFIKSNNPEDILGVLLDLNMPNVDGFEVLEFFRKNDLFINIPVVIITGDDTKETVDKTFEYSIVDVLNKPFTERDINRVVMNMINFE